MHNAYFKYYIEAVMQRPQVVYWSKYSNILQQNILNILDLMTQISKNGYFFALYAIKINIVPDGLCNGLI